VEQWAVSSSQTYQAIGKEKPKTLLAGIFNFDRFFLTWWAPLPHG